MGLSRSVVIRPSEQPVPILKGMSEALVTVEINFDDGGIARLNFGGLEVTYDQKKQLLTCGKIEVPWKAKDGRLVKMDCLVDRGSVEIFDSDGLIAISAAHLARADAPTLTASGDKARVVMTWRQMKSAWK
jgi:hypothetical protein